MNALPPRLKEELDNYTWGYIEQYKNLTPQELVEELTTDVKARRNKNPWESFELADELPDFNYEPISIYNPIDTSKQSIDVITPGSFDPSKNAFICSLCSVLVSRREFAKHFERRHSSTSTHGEIRRPSSILPYDALKWYEKRELKTKSRSKSTRRIEEQIRLNKKSKSSIITASTTRAIRHSGNSATKLLNNVVKAAAVVSQRQRAKRQLSNNCRADNAVDIGSQNPPHIPTDERVPPLICVDKFNSEHEAVEPIGTAKYPPNKRRRGSNSSPSREDVLTDVLPPDISYHPASQHLQNSAMWPGFDSVVGDCVPQPASSSSPDIEVELEPEPMDMETENAVASIMTQHSCESRLLSAENVPSGSVLNNPTSNKLRNTSDILSSSSRAPPVQAESCKSENPNTPFDLHSHLYENGYVPPIANRMHCSSTENWQKNSFRDKYLPKSDLLLKQLVSNSRLEPSKHSPLSPLNPCVTPRPVHPLAICSMSCMLTKRKFTAPNPSPSSRFKSLVIPRSSLWRSKKRSSCNGPATLTKFRGTSAIKSKPASKILYQDRSPMFIHKPGDIQATPIVLDNNGNPLPSGEKSINGKKRNVRQTVMRQNPAMRFMGNSQKASSTALYTNDAGMVSPTDMPLRETQSHSRPVILIGAKNKAQQSNNLATQDNQQLHSPAMHLSGVPSSSSVLNSNHSGVLPSSNSVIGRMGHASNQIQTHTSNHQLSRSSSLPQSNNQKLTNSVIQPGLTRNSTMGPVISIVTSEPTLTDGSMALSRGTSNTMFSGSGHASLESVQGHGIAQSSAAGGHPFMQKTRLTASELHQLRNGGGVVLPNRGFAVSQQAQCLSQPSPSFSQASHYINGSNLPSGGNVILASNASTLNTNTAPVHQHSVMEPPMVQHSYQNHHVIVSEHSGSSNTAGMMAPNSQYISQNQVVHTVGPLQPNESNAGTSPGDQMMHLHQLQRQYYSQPGTPLPQHSAISLGGTGAQQSKVQPSQQILQSNSHNMTYKQQPPLTTQQRRSFQMQRLQANFPGQHIITGNQSRGRIGGRLIPANHMVDMVDMDASPNSQPIDNPQVVHISAPVKQQARSVGLQQQQQSARVTAPTGQQVWNQQQSVMSQGHTILSGPGSQQSISQQQTGPISQKLRSQVLSRMARSRHGDAHSDQNLENLEMVCSAAVPHEQMGINNPVTVNSHPIQCLPASTGGRSGGPSSNLATHSSSLDKMPLFIRQPCQTPVLPTVINTAKEKHNHDLCINSVPAKCSVPVHSQSSSTLTVTSQSEFMRDFSHNSSNVLYMPVLNNDNLVPIAVDPNAHPNSSILPS